MKKLLVASTLSALFLLGCGKNKAVKASEDMADAVCACKDLQCAMEAAKKGQQELMGMLDEKGTQSDVDAIKDATKKMQSCVEALGKQMK
jgi:hypothetical protein